MSVCIKLKKMLDENHVKYLEVSHSKAYTSQEIALSMNVTDKELAKSIVVRDNGNFSLVVLPASYKINFELLKTALGKEQVHLASESSLKSLFPECEIGAMCPFGNLYNIPTYIAKSIRDQQEIVFNAGTHTDAIRMSMDDYMKLANPTIMQISEKTWPNRL